MPRDGGPACDSASCVAENAAAFVSQSVPPSVAAGSTFSVQVTMKNTGLATWTLKGTGKNDGYYLGSQDPQDNFTWGTNRSFMAPGDAVAPGQTYNFRVSLTAPTSPGKYTM